LRPVIQNAVNQAKAGKRLFPPTLIFGSPGLGKSSLAYVIARETDTVPLSYTGGKDWTGIRFKKELLNMDVRGYGPGGKWQPGAKRYSFILDEVHAIHGSAWESLFSPIEDLEVHDGGTVFWLPDIQWIFMTTRPASLPKPFLDRLPLQLHLEPYSVAELCQIIRRIHPNMAVPVVEEVARRSCGVARLALNFAQSVEDYPEGLKWFDIMRIDCDGLNDWQRKYLAILESANRPVSLSAMSSMLRENAPTVQLLEEELLRQNRIEVSAQGRSLIAQERGPKVRYD
jgi:Holliday junction DNA helicase RuvB